MPAYIYKPDQYSSHTKILRQVNSIKRKNMKILDVGCAQGYLAKELSAKGHEVTGIEIDKDAAEQAKQFCNHVITGDIDTLKPGLKQDYFDIIIFGDVLEHLKDAENTLSSYLNLLRSNGFIIASTSNVANLYMRLNLLIGRFNYSDRGILDRTHLHLFTLKSFKHMMRRAGLKILKIDTAPIPLPIVIKATARGKPLNILHQINYLLAKLWSTMFGFQFIILARKRF